MTNSPKKTGEFVSGRFFSSVRYEAARRNIPFDLDITFLDSLLEQQGHRCAYSGLSIDAKTRGGITASLDRIDSTKGYYPENVQFVEKNINMMKWKFPEDMFLTMVKNIYINSIQE